MEIDAFSPPGCLGVYYTYSSHLDVLGITPRVGLSHVGNNEDIPKRTVAGLDTPPPVNSSSRLRLEPDKRHLKQGTVITSSTTR